MCDLRRAQVGSRQFQWKFRPEPADQPTTAEVVTKTSSVKPVGVTRADGRDRCGDCQRYSIAKCKIHGRAATARAKKAAGNTLGPEVGKAGVGSVGGKVGKVNSLDAAAAASGLGLLARVHTELIEPEPPSDGLSGRSSKQAVTWADLRSNHIPWERGSEDESGSESEGEDESPWLGDFEGGDSKADGKWLQVKPRFVRKKKPLLLGEDGGGVGKVVETSPVATRGLDRYGNLLNGPTCYTGVTPVPAEKQEPGHRWNVVIHHKDEAEYVGSYDTEKKAVRAYNKRAKELGRKRSGLLRYHGPSQLYNPELYDSEPTPSQDGQSEGGAASEEIADPSADAEWFEKEREESVEEAFEPPPRDASDNSAVIDGGDAAG